MTRNRIIALALILVLSSLGGFLIYANAFWHYDAVYPNVTCEGRDLSGLSYEDAAAAINEIIAQKQFTVDLVLPDGQTARIHPAQTVSEAEPGAALAAVWDVGRKDGSFFGPLAGYRRALGGVTEIPIQYALSYSQKEVSAQVTAFRDQIYQDPTPCAGEADREANCVTVRLGSAGRTLDPEAVAAQVRQALESGQETLELPYTVIPLDRDALDALIKDLDRQSHQDPTEPSVEYDEEGQTALVHLGQPGFSLDRETAAETVLAASEAGEDAVTIPLEQVAPKDFDLDGYYSWLKRDPEEVYFLENGVLGGGSPGFDMDLAEAKELLAGAGVGDTVAIPLEVTEPTLTYEQAQEALFRDRLGSSDTYHTADYNRTTNLRLACEAINGTVINPGEEFSFNGVVGERTAEKGYRTGIVYVNSNSEPQLGGGICQVATGCYQAALLSGMEILERSEHMFPVTYCAGGLDATVYWGSLDFRFRNPWNMPIRVNASVSDGQVHISIDGSNFTGQFIRLSSERVSAYAGHTAYRAYQTVYNADGSVYEVNNLGVSTYQNH